MDVPSDEGALVGGGVVPGGGPLEVECSRGADERGSEPEDGERQAGNGGADELQSINIDALEDRSGTEERETVPANDREDGIDEIPMDDTNRLPNLTEDNNTNGPPHLAENAVDEREPPEARMNIKLVGDSMVRGFGKYMHVQDPGSELRSIPGAGILQILRVAKTSLAQEYEGALIIQGGGNSLNVLGAERTVESMIQAVREIHTKYPKCELLVIGIIPRPSEGERYEGVRRNVNRKLASGIDRMMGLWGRRRGWISFLSPDEYLIESDFAADSVHLNDEGKRRLSEACNRWLSWRRLAGRTDACEGGDSQRRRPAPTPARSRGGGRAGGRREPRRGGGRPNRGTGRHSREWTRSSRNSPTGPHRAD